MMQTEGIWRPFTHKITLGQWRPFANMNSTKDSKIQKVKNATKKNTNGRKSKPSPKKSNRIEAPSFLTDFKIPRRKSNVENKPSPNSPKNSTMQKSTSPLKRKSSSPIPAIFESPAANPLFRKGQSRVSHILPNVDLSLQDNSGQIIFGAGQKTSVESVQPVPAPKKPRLSATSSIFQDLKKKKPMYNKIEEKTKLLLRNIKSSAKQRAHMNAAPSNTTNCKPNNINSKQLTEKLKLDTQRQPKSIISEKQDFANAIQANNTETCSKKTRVSKKNVVTEKVKKKDNVALSKKKKFNSVSKTSEDRNLKSPQPKVNKRFKRVRPLSDTDSDEEAFPGPNTEMCVPAVNPSIIVEEKDTTESSCSVPEDSLQQNLENICESNTVSNIFLSTDSVDESNESFISNSYLPSASCDSNIADAYCAETDCSSSLSNPASELIENEEEEVSVIECNQNEHNCASTQNIIEIILSDSEDDDIIVVDTVPAKKNDVIEQLSNKMYNYLQQLSANKGMEILSDLKEAEKSMYRIPHL